MASLFRTLLPALLCLTLFSTATAQEAAPATDAAPAPRVYKHEIGLFVLTGGPASDNGYNGIQGIMFRQANARHPQSWWKLGLGTGISSSLRQGYNTPIHTGSDTTLSIQVYRLDRIYTALAGMETERHLWRRIYLTAGLEAQLGFSTGHLDSVTQVTYPQISASAPQSSSSRLGDTRSYFGTGLALLGARAYMGRITAGVEFFTGLYVGSQHERGYGILDLRLGNFGSRLSLGYRF